MGRQGAAGPGGPAGDKRLLHFKTARNIISIKRDTMNLRKCVQIRLDDDTANRILSHLTGQNADNAQNPVSMPVSRRVVGFSAPAASPLRMGFLRLSPMRSRMNGRIRKCSYTLKLRGLSVMLGQKSRGRSVDPPFGAVKLTLRKWSVRTEVDSLGKCGLRTYSAMDTGAGFDKDIVRGFPGFLREGPRIPRSSFQGRPYFE